MPYSSIHTHFVSETTSTNELAKKLFKEKELNLPFIVQTNFQSQGKGQYLKSWESKAGDNLLFSLVIKAPPIDIEKQFDISKAVAVAIRDVLKKITNAKVCIKWPNDIYVDDDKIAGILIENTIVGSEIDTCIIGIGLNVNQTQFSRELPNPTSIKLITNTEVNIDFLKSNIASTIISNLKNLEYSSKIYDTYLYRKGELGKFISNKNSEFLGVIIGIDPIGKLRIRIENNIVETFSNNEIKFVLPHTN